MNNIDALRKIITSMESVAKDEMLDFLEAIEEEIGELQEQASELRSDKKDLEEQVKDLEDNDEDLSGDSVDLGLDTLYYRLEKGNIRVAAQLQSWCNAVRKQNALPELMVGEIS